MLMRTTVYCQSCRQSAAIGDIVRPADQPGSRRANRCRRWAREVEIATAHVIGKQVEAGVDVGNDGEQSRVGFQTCVPRCLCGFGTFTDCGYVIEEIVWGKLAAAAEGAHRLEPVVGSGQRVTPPEALRRRFAVIGRDTIPLRQRNVRRTPVRTRGRDPRAPCGR